jgi:YesN/AraC family two-component response regulator
MNNHILQVAEKKELLSGKIKAVISEMLQCDEMPLTNISVYISGNLHFNYSYISDVFSSVNGITIEHYIIQKRIEKGITLLKDTDLDIGEIARRLCYKSCTHFSAQFRAHTGYTPSFFRRISKLKTVIN